MAHTEPADEILADAGCDKEFIDRFQIIQRNGTLSELLVMLNSHRAKLLNNLHKYQKRIDCLDYLVYQLKKGENIK